MACKPMFRAIALLTFVLAANVQSLPTGFPPTTYRIAGIVVDSVTNQPLEGTEVTLAPVTALDDAQTFLTSSGGHFLFANLPAGKYRLMANRSGYALQALNEHEAYSTAIVLGPGLDSEHIRFRLSPSSVITGIVTDDWGDPVREVKILLFQQNMFEGSSSLRNINQTKSDDQGRYRFAHLRSGTYAVAVYARPWYTQSQVRVTADVGEGGSSGTFVVDGGSLLSVIDNSLFDVVYPITFFPNATSLTEATRLALAPGATETADILLRAVPSVHLRVRVPVQPPTTATVASETHDSKGNAQETSTTSEIDSSPDVALSLKIGDYYTEPIEATPKEIGPGIVELSGIPPGEINLVASSMNARDGSYVSRNTTLNVSGDAELDLSLQGVPANVSGVVLASQFSAAVATPSRQAESDQPSTDQTFPDPVIQTTPAPALEDTPSLVGIEFRSLKDGESYNATISGQGKFSFAGSALPAGSYELKLVGKSQLRVSSLEATGATVSGHTIEIPASQPVNVTVHAAEANCALSGFALKNGKPLAGAMVLLVPQDPGHDMSLYRRDQSDSDGSFAMSALFPGRYILLAIENGWELEWADPKVMFQYLPAGQPLELKPGASLNLNAKVQ